MSWPCSSKTKRRLAATRPTVNCFASGSANGGNVARETADWLEKQMGDAPEGDFTEVQLQRIIREGREFHRKRRK